MKNKALLTLLIFLLGVPFFVGAIEPPKTWDEVNRLAKENYAELVKENEERQAQELVKNEESTTSNNAKPSSTDKSIMGKDIKGVTLFITIILSILFTWGLGLIVPVLLRFVVLKRPVSKIIAIAIVTDCNLFYSNRSCYRDEWHEQGPLCSIFSSNRGLFYYAKRLQK